MSKRKFLLFLVFGGLIFGIFLIFSYKKLSFSSVKNFKYSFNQFSPTSSPTKLPIITLIAVGDVMLGRTINYHSVKNNNFTWMWEKTVNELRSADLTLINLESPLVENCPVTTSGMIFCGDPKNIEGLKFAEIDLVNLANNHIANYGKKGIENTINLLNGANIVPIGTNTPVYKNIKGIKFAFLGYSDFAVPQEISQVKKEKIIQEIAQAKTQADIIIISFHWGEEYTNQPTSRQKELAYLAIDSGADLVIGHHPHWIQPEEFYKEKLIVYSLGNFIFDQFWSEKTTQGLLGKFIFEGKKLVSYQLIPIKIIPPGQPTLENFP
ncbi:MAG: CapA family protein [Microgenomates group bacterium]